MLNFKKLSLHSQILLPQCQPKVFLSMKQEQEKRTLHQAKLYIFFYPTQILLQKSCSISSRQLFLSNMRIIFNALRKENILVAKIPILPCMVNLHCQGEKKQDCFCNIFTALTHKPLAILQKNVTTSYGKTATLCGHRHLFSIPFR